MAGNDVVVKKLSRVYTSDGELPVQNARQVA